MARRCLCLIVALLSLSLVPTRAEAQDCCEEARHLQSKLAHLQADADRLSASAAASHRHEASLKEHVEHLKGEVAHCQAHHASKEATVTVAAVVAALQAGTAHYAQTLKTETLALGQELSEGKFDRLTSLAHCLLKSTQHTVLALVKTLQGLVETYVPKAVVQQVQQHVAVAQTWLQQHMRTAKQWYQQNIGSMPVARQVTAQLTTVHEELSSAVLGFLSSHPALASLAEPVAVQLVVGGMFALPLLLLVVLMLVLATRGPSGAAGSQPVPKAKKKKGKKQGHAQASSSLSQ